MPAFLYGPDGTILAANDLSGALAGRELAGCSAAHAVSIFTPRRPDGTLLAPAELPVSIALAGGEVIEAPLAITVADGRTLHFLVTASPIREDGTLAGALVLWQDAPGHGPAEQELARYVDDLRGSRGQLDDVIEATGAGFYQIALERMEGTISRCGAEILGFSTLEMPSLFEIIAEAQARMHPDDLDGVLRSFLTFVEVDTERNEVEFRVRSLDGGGAGSTRSAPRPNGTRRDEWSCSQASSSISTSGKRPRRPSGGRPRNCSASRTWRSMISRSR